eukprot:scaffold30998_cov66-Phaeocystis_antarctica.AAC.2
MKREFETFANESSNGIPQRLPADFTKEEVHAYHTLLSFPFTESDDDEPREDKNITKSMERALESVKNSGYSVIVLVGGGPSLPNLLEERRVRAAYSAAPSSSCAAALAPPRPRPTSAFARFPPHPPCLRIHSHAFLCAVGGGQSRPDYIESCVVHRRGLCYTRYYRIAAGLAADASTRRC